MIVEKLKLTNFRGIDKMELDFDPKVNVIFGANGAGKSTILDALAISLSWAANRIKHSSSSGKPIVERDIKNDTSFSSLEIETDFAGWKIVKNRKGRGSPGGKSDFSQLKEFVSSVQNTLEQNDNNIGLPLFVYYPVNRAVVDIPLRIRKRHSFDDIFSAYDEALDGGASFRAFFEWYREKEDLENEMRLSDNDNIAPMMDYHLQTVRRAWEAFLPEFKNFRVGRSPLRLEVEKNGEKVSVNQLSDGEKILITVVGDLARRLAIANPGLNNPLECKAIVLIDEIDLHLHPAWQRMVIEKFPKVFPNCQFIVTTHSPHVLTHTTVERLIKLTQEDMKIDWERPYESYGKNVDRVLEDLMGLKTTRPNSVEEELASIYTHINNGEVTVAKQKIAQLKELIGEDPDLVRAAVLIKRREIIGK